MVLKKSKFGGNTGNTLRKSFFKGANKVSKDAAFITKAEKKLQPFDDIQNDWICDNNLGVKRDGNVLNSTDRYVRLSLSKDKRWMLPQSLKDQIVSKSYDNDKVHQLKDLKMKLNKHKKRSLQTEVNVPQSSNVAIIEKPGDWMFHNCGSHQVHQYCKYFAESESDKTKKESKSWRSSLKVPIEAEVDNITTYTIERSFVSSVAWPYHTDGGSLNNYYKEKNLKGNHHRRKIFKSSFSSSLHDDEMEDGYFSEDEDGNYNAESSNKYQQPVPLESYIVCDKKKITCAVVKEQRSKERVNPASGEFVVKHEKGSFKSLNVVFDSQTRSPSLLDEKPKLEKRKQNRRRNNRQQNQQFDCRIPITQLTTEFLSLQYGESYIEGSTFPRIFVLLKNISQNGTLIHFKVGKEEKNTCIVSISLINNSLITPPESCSVVDLLDMTSKVFNESIKPETIERTKFIKQKATYEKFKPRASVLSVDSLWNNCIIKGEAIITPGCYGYEEVCPICFLDNPVRYMGCCGHYFCDECWRNYVNTKVTSGFYNLKCLEFNCNTQIDYVTIIGYLDPNKFDMFNAKLIDIHVMKNESLKYCPNEKCTKVAFSSIKTDESNKIFCNIPVVNCTCRRKWCFECQKPDHWPASCKAFESYEKQKERDLGIIFDEHGKVYQVQIKFKRCPFCKNPVEKNGGCNYMSCVCGRAFCWLCLKDFNKHETCTYVNDSEINFTSFDDLNGLPKIARRHRKALQYAFSSSRMLTQKQKLSIEKIISRLEKNFEPRQTSILVITKKAFDLVFDGYKLMENMTVAGAFCMSRHTSARLMRFIEQLKFCLKILENCLNVSDLSRIKVGNVSKAIKEVEDCLQKIESFGVKVQPL